MIHAPRGAVACRSALLSRDFAKLPVTYSCAIAGGINENKKIRFIRHYNFSTGWGIGGAHVRTEAPSFTGDFQTVAKPVVIHSHKLRLQFVIIISTGAVHQVARVTDENLFDRWQSSVFYLPQTLSLWSTWPGVLRGSRNAFVVPFHHDNLQRLRSFLPPVSSAPWRSNVGSSS